MKKTGGTSAGSALLLFTDGIATVAALLLNFVVGSPELVPAAQHDAEMSQRTHGARPREHRRQLPLPPPASTMRRLGRLCIPGPPPLAPPTSCTSRAAAAMLLPLLLLLPPPSLTPMMLCGAGIKPGMQRSRSLRTISSRSLPFRFRRYSRRTCRRGRRSCGPDRWRAARRRLWRVFWRGSAAAAAEPARASRFPARASRGHSSARRMRSRTSSRHRQSWAVGGKSLLLLLLLFRLSLRQATALIVLLSRTGSSFIALSFEVITETFTGINLFPKMVTLL